MSSAPRDATHDREEDDQHHHLHEIDERFAHGLHRLAPVGGKRAEAQTKLLRFPAIHGDRVAFTYGGDLWTASAA